MPASIGFWYERDGYDTTGKRLLGRQSAGESFLKALVQHSSAQKLCCVSPTEEQYQDCLKRVSSWQLRREIAFLPTYDPQRIAEAGVLYRPDPSLTNLAWLRRSAGQRLYSLCGVTHTICTKETMQNLGQLAIAPLQPWDALICTSTAVKTAVDGMLKEWCGYLKSRCGGEPTAPPQLPVIPLGIESLSFAPTKQTPSVRAGLRRTLEIGIEDVAVLYVGRLNFYAKAHPIPMYFALERTARQTGKKLHLIQVGWFEQEREEKAFKEAAQKFCPSVTCIFLDGRRPEVRAQAWAASDVFVSLSDNIQETFGLTPLEAMAAGLPVICSDWDGYQETVRHEVDGFRVPVIMPPPGTGRELARDYLCDRLMFNAYIGRTAQCTAVDIDVVTKQLIALVEHPELRRRMGEAGQTRARTEFDWSVIVRRYEALWEQLAELRAVAPEIAPAGAGASGHPLCGDPFQVFSHYTGNHLQPQHVLSLGSCGTVEIAATLTKDWMSSFGGDCRLGVPEVGKILNQLKTAGPTPLAAFLPADPGQVVAVYRTVGWLIKFGVVRVLGREA